jgi:hypothetical protein
MNLLLPFLISDSFFALISKNDDLVTLMTFTLNIIILET